MTPDQQKLLDAWQEGRLPLEQLRASFPDRLLDDVAFLESELQLALDAESSGALDTVAQLVLLSDSSETTHLKNRLLVTPNHFQHQAIARSLQSIKSPTTVAYVREALQMGFGHLEYSASEPEVIAKWFSWLLFDIGTAEAIALIREYATEEPGPVGDEMRRRLSKIPNER